MGDFLQRGVEVERHLEQDRPANFAFTSDFSFLCFIGFVSTEESKFSIASKLGFISLVFLGFLVGLFTIFDKLLKEAEDVLKKVGI